MTECSRGGEVAGRGRERELEQVTFAFGGGRPVTVRFDSECVTQDAGLAALRELDERLELTELAASFVNDSRDPRMVVHSVSRLVREVVYAYAAGYDDANDHSPLSHDVWFERLVGPSNAASVNPKAHEGLASEAMISRFLHELGLDATRLALAPLEQFMRVVSKDPPEQITLDIDGFDAETFGCQQLALFNGHYEETMYYPLLVTVAEYGFAVAGRLRPGNAWSAADAVSVLRPVLAELRRRFPDTRIAVRADSGFMDPAIYELCEEFGVEYVIRQRMNAVLQRYVDEFLAARAARTMERHPTKAWSLYHGRMHRARSWSRKRRVILKIQHDPTKHEFERYVLATNSRRSNRKAWRLYEGRGLGEQRIDELRNHLRADKFSLSTFEANDLKLQFMLLAYNLHAAARTMLPEGHELKRATVGRLVVSLVKCGAVVVRTARRLWLHASRTWPFGELLADVSRRFALGRLVPTPLWNTG
jgi:hypothetical protein